MKRILVNFYNQFGAGPKNISLNFIKESKEINNKNIKFYIIVQDREEYSDLTSSENVTILKFPSNTKLLDKIFFRINLDFKIIPEIIKKEGIESLLAFGNFLMTNSNIKKTVLLHHLYIIDNKLYNKLPFKSKIIEKMKRIVFDVTKNNVDNIVVQSDYMKNFFNEFYKNQYSEKIKIIHNPIMETIKRNIPGNIKKLIDNRLENINSNNINLLYVSRYYPHKNHDFLIELSRFLKKEKSSIKIKITVPKNKETELLLSTIKDEDLNIENIGLVNQEELISHYENASIFIFPSKSETFGNPMIEALGFGIPVIVPDLEYSHAIVAENGTYYNEDEVVDCYDKIKNILENEDKYINLSKSSNIFFNKYPNTKDWVNQYLKII